jgi:hypothetical protein
LPRRKISEFSRFYYENSGGEKDKPPENLKRAEDGVPARLTAFRNIQNKV